jgi:hypothetical protein
MVALGSRDLRGAVRVVPAWAAWGQEFGEFDIDVPDTGDSPLDVKEMCSISETLDSYTPKMIASCDHV